MREYSGGYDLKFLQLMSISPSIGAQPHFKECFCITYFHVNNVLFKSTQQVVSLTFPLVFLAILSWGVLWTGIERSQALFWPALYLRLHTETPDL